MTTEAYARLGNRIIDVLQSRAAQKIDFILGSVHVSPLGLNPVALAVRKWIAGQKGIGVEVIDTLPRNAAAQYAFDKDVYLVPRFDFGTGADERMHFYHESVHAMRDIEGATEKGRTSSTFIEDEAAAYVAGCLFRLYDSGSTPDSDPKTFPHFKIASLIARSIASVKTPAVVSTGNAGMLKTLIRFTPLYNDAGVQFATPAAVDGVKS